MTVLFSQIMKEKSTEMGKYIIFTSTEKHKKCKYTFKHREENVTLMKEK